MMLRNASFLAVGLLFCSAAVFGAGGVPDSPIEPGDPVIEAAQAAIAKNDWVGARKGLQEALARNAQNANYHNLYAYTTRKGPKPDMNLVFKHYNEALRIDPKHKGALEYSGELYLMMGNLPMAEQRLAALDKACFLPCEQYTDLKQAVARFKANGNKFVAR